MTYTLVILGLLTVAAIAAVVWMRRDKQKTEIAESPEKPKYLAPEAQITKLRRIGKYWGYKIESHCRASSCLAGQKYAFEDTPPLPIQGCELKVCGCCLIGLAEQRRMRDRRSGQDRRRSIRIDSTDRRAKHPRRNDDHNSWGSYSHL